MSAEFGIMLHAERVADGSGASNYDGLPLSDWPDGRFRGAAPICLEIAIEERDEEHDLRWLQAGGFDPVGPIMMQQLFATTPDHNDEIVITLMRRVANCDELDERSVTATGLDDARAMVTISPFVPRDKR